MEKPYKIVRKRDETGENVEYSHYKIEPVRKPRPKNFPTEDRSILDRAIVERENRNDG
jgi:hypothetical protein